MYELPPCQGVVEIIQRQAEQHDAKRVTAVRLEIDALSCVEKSTVRFSFEIVCHGTVAQGCDLHIVYKPAQAWCRDCSQVVEIHQYDAQCPLCHGERLCIDTGDSLIVKSIEVEQPELIMCIGVPGQVLAVGEDIHQPMQVEVYGIKCDVNIALICEGNPADLLDQRALVHAGPAVSIIDEDEAKVTLDALRQMDYDITSM